MPRPYRHTAPVPQKSATGQVAAVYAQMKADFLLADGPLMSLSPAPEVLAATWALLREAEIVGTAARADKEAVASAVSLANRCPFCTEAHALLAHGAGDHELAEAARAGRPPADRRRAAVLDWAAATRSPGAPALSAPPFPPAQTPEFVGTVLVTHFINRMVTSLLDEEALLPGAVRRSRYVRRAAGLTVASAARRNPAPGAGLAVLAGPSPVGPPPAWAGEGPIGTAYLALRDAAAAGGELLDAAARAAVIGAVADWDGGHPPLGGDPTGPAVASLPEVDRPGARLALLAALAPYRITDGEVAAWRSAQARRAIGAGQTNGSNGSGRAGDGGGADGSDGALTRVLAFGAMAAVLRVEAWTVSGTRTAPTP
ncbi:carboxymuconolactone decarboxylase family protein [Kitasatospora sp. NPDC058170]|uniref:carboxymuconolactone decarboxylase family protein n=1 Tax=Kitasatospora sp. NPDC058170 TaxID=3346364 RepID=UPI0036D85895